jgi:hypothetical protein
MTYYEDFQSASPDRQTLASVCPCVATHGGHARLLVAWFEPSGATVLASLPSRRGVGRHQRR